MWARAVRATNVRCYDRLELELPSGLVAAIGPNGAGKTSLVELVHLGCAGFSPRTSHEADMVRLGADFLRVEEELELGGRAARVELGYRPGEPKRVVVDGAPERSAERLVARFPVLVFTPDRLRVVKGAPALRRAYFDRVAARLWPALAPLAAEHGRALAQRNHLLRRVRSGTARADALDPWDAAAARTGAALGQARARLVRRLVVRLSARMAELGGDPPEDPLRYRPNAPAEEAVLAAALRERRARDVERGLTGAGPHLDDFQLVDGDRDLRRFGSQGEQRRALVALVLAEADLIVEERDEPPLLLLDDVTGELDAERRRRLLDAVAAFPQTVVTTTDPGELAGRPAAVLRVDGGRVTGP